MKLSETPIADLYVIEPKIFSDERGYFFESFTEKTFVEKNINLHFVQDNQSMSKKGTLRGLHMQFGTHAQTKLVRVLSGAVLDVAVDLRLHSKTYKQYFSLLLSAENKKQMLIPRGFAHGFLTLTDTAEFFYKCDNFYAPTFEGGIRFDDPAINIDWQLKEHHISKDELLINQKDLALPPLKAIESFL